MTLIVPIRVIHHLCNTGDSVDTGIVGLYGFGLIQSKSKSDFDLKYLINLDLDFNFILNGFGFGL